MRRAKRQTEQKLMPIAIYRISNYLGYCYDI